MDYEPDGHSESLIPATQAKTALRTHYVLVAARLSFLFSHGALLVAASSNLGQDASTSWWTIFTPVWLGDAMCAVLIIYSWFASCPYIKLCLGEKQARLGDANPSILTELLPEIVMAVLGLLFVLVAWIGELLFCKYLDASRRGETAHLLPSALVFMLLSLCACCRGIFIQTDGELFSLLGAVTLVTFMAALVVKGGLWGDRRWVLILPPFGAAAGLVAASSIRLRQNWASGFMNCEERILQIIELAALVVVLLALTILVIQFFLIGGCTDDQSSCSGGFGIFVGGGICVIAALRARMALLETRMSCRTVACSEPLPGWVVSPMANEATRNAA